MAVLQGKGAWCGYGCNSRSRSQLKQLPTTFFPKPCAIPPFSITGRSKIFLSSFRFFFFVITIGSGIVTGQEKPGGIIFCNHYS
eukprot:1236051-Amphidinium_carterae.1